MTLTSRVSLELIVGLLLVVADKCSGEVIDLQMSEEMPIGSVIADLRNLITKIGKFSDTQWINFKSAGSDDIGKRLVDVSQ